MFNIPQSTAYDDLFFAHDENGDAVTGLIDGDFTKRISKNGAAFGNMTVTITEREAGWYHFQLSTSHTDTQGALTLYFAATGIKQVNLKFLVGSTASNIAAIRAKTDKMTFTNPPNEYLLARVETFSGQSLNELFLTPSDYTHWDAVEYSVLYEIIAGVWDFVLGVYNDPGSAGERLNRLPNIDAGSSGGLPTVDNNNHVAGTASLGTQAKTDVQTEATNALNTYDPPTKAELDAAQASIEAAISAISGMTPEEIKEAVVEALTTDTYADPTTPPPDPASLKDQIGWVFARAMGVFIQDPISQTLRNRGDSETIAQRTITASPTQAKLNEWQP